MRVVTLPEGEDPDTFVGAYGGEHLEAQLRAALDLFERKVQLLERAGWFGDLHHKRRAIDRLLPTIRATVDPILRDLYVSRASEAAGVPKALLWREVGGEGTPAPAPGRDTAAASRSTRASPARVVGGERRARIRRTPGRARSASSCGRC